MNASPGVATALVPALVSVLAGCAPTQATRTDSTGPVVVRTGTAGAPDSASVRRDVRVESIQRVDSDDGKSVAGVVTVRNLSDVRHTVRVSVIWTDGTGKPLAPGGTTAQSVTLASGEFREVRFDGAPGSRDFKVALGAAAN